LTTIVGLGIAAALFLALMSMFYLQQIPNQQDLDRLEADLRREHGLFFASAAPLEIHLVMGEKEGERPGVRVRCTLRPDVIKRPEAVDAYFDRIAESVLEHPEFKGRVAWATVVHAPPVQAERTRHARKDRPAP
jgi:hypothetical protein